jgi:cytoskeleton protein RodZ
MAETIGQQLKKAREERYLTIAKVVEETRIRAHYIEAMEVDNFDFLPSPVQARGFLRLYAEFLGLSMEELISRQRDGAGAESVPAPVAAPAPPAPSPASPASKADAKAQRPPRRRKQAQVKREPSPAAGELPAASPPAEAKPLAAAAPPALPAAVSNSQLIFASIGSQLQARRTSLSLTLEEVERHIRVRKHYLQAMEAGQLDQLPSSVQARGMLNNYTHFLDLDVDAILLKFAEGLQARHKERLGAPAPEAESPQPEAPSKAPLVFTFKLPANFHFPPRIHLPAGLRRYLSADLIVGGGLTLFLVIFAIWGTSRVVSLRAAPTPQSTAPSILDVLVASQAFTETPTPTSGTQAAPVAPTGAVSQAASAPTGGQGPVQIVAVASASTWVRISVDGKAQFEGRMTPGAAYSYDGSTQIEVVTGDGSAVSITYNQNELGPMGNFGEVVDRIYTANAVLNPTPTYTPTPTKSPIPSATLRPTATSRFSPLPSQTPTIP